MKETKLKLNSVWHNNVLSIRTQVQQRKLAKYFIISENIPIKEH